MSFRLRSLLGDSNSSGWARSALSAALAVAVLAGCNGGDQPPSAANDRPSSVLPPKTSPNSAEPAPAPTSTVTPAPTQSTLPAAPADPVGKPQAGCLSSDPHHQCIGIKAVAYSDVDGAAVTTEDRVRSLVDRVNALWKTCDVAFQVEHFTVVDPRDYGLSFGTQSQSELSQIRRAFSDASTFLVGFTGAWNTSTIAWTEMPGGPPFGTIVSAEVADNEIVLGHELGHYMGLDHYNDSSNLMNPVVYSTARHLTATQCSDARDTNLSEWPDMLRN